MRKSFTEEQIALGTPSSTVRPFRILTVVDTFTRQSPLLAADTSLNGNRVAELLDIVAADRGHPKTIQVDNGTEFYSKVMDSWAYHRGVQLQFIRPGKPVGACRSSRRASRKRPAGPTSRSTRYAPAGGYAVGLLVRILSRLRERWLCGEVTGLRSAARGSRRVPRPYRGRR